MNNRTTEQSKSIRTIVKKNEPHYAEIWMCCLNQEQGSVQSGYRPVYIASNNINNKYSTTLNIIPITSKKKMNLPIHVILENYQEFGLSSQSTLLVEQIMTVDVSSLHRRLGKITDNYTLRRIGEAMEVQFPNLTPKNKIEQ